MKKITIKKSDKDRFFAFFQQGTPDECWEWRGGKGRRDGRGRFWVDGSTRTAAVISYLIYKGEIENGLYVCHKCDNPSCINPNHLFLGTNSDNMKDMAKKGRRVYHGDSAPNHKLTYPQVSQIRFLASIGVKQKYIAKVFGVHPTNISHVVRGKTFLRGSES